MTADGRTYAVRSLAAEEENGDGHGGGVVHSGTLAFLPRKDV